MKPLDLHSEAAEELEEGARHYEREREGLGAEFLQEVEEATARIQSNPKLYPVWNDRSYRKCRIHRFPYTIFYLEFDDRIWIASVAHQKRKPGYWTGRSPQA